MTTRSQKKKAVAELVSGDFEDSLAENNPRESLIAGPSKSDLVSKNIQKYSENVFQY